MPRQVFVTMKLPKTMVLQGRDGFEDRTTFYLAALNSHDGYLPVLESRRHLWMECFLWTHHTAIRPLSATWVTFRP